MSDFDPSGGRPYQPPVDYIPPRETPDDRGFQQPVNPDGADIGPLYINPAYDYWFKEHVTDPGYVIDWGNYEIIDPQTGDVVEPVPKSIPRMI